MERIKFSGLDRNAGSYDSSHAGSYPSPRVCIPERCFTKCTHCIEFNHPPQKNQFFRLVSTPLPGHAANALRERVHRKTIGKKITAEIPGYQILLMSHGRCYGRNNRQLFVLAKMLHLIVLLRVIRFHFIFSIFWISLIFLVFSAFVIYILDRIYFLFKCLIRSRFHRCIEYIIINC